MAKLASANEQSREVAAEFAVQRLLVAAAFPHRVSELMLRETLVSWIVLTGQYAYKIKKCVALPFMDCSTLARRHELCLCEVRLNRRLAPDLYLDVVAITQAADGPRVGGDGRVIEYAVRMRQFDESQQLDALLNARAVATAEVEDLAVSIASFHRAAPVAAPAVAFPHTSMLRAAIMGNLATLLTQTCLVSQLGDLGRLVDFTHDSYHDLLPLLEQREAYGFIRECHGDLHAGNIVRWHGHLTPFDCLEFDPDLRWIDVMNDVAFLVMDLLSHHRPDLAYAFLNHYLDKSGDYSGVRLLRFYAIYRALVRAKVDALQADGPVQRADAFISRLCVRMSTAITLMDRPPPCLIIMHGVSGSGKSWLSQRLSYVLPAIRLRSDIERRRLRSSAPTAVELRGTTMDPYSPEFTQRTYERLAEGAEACLHGGESVIVDATFLHFEQRHRFQALAGKLGVRYVIVDCPTAVDVAQDRVLRRQSAGTDASEAGLAVLTRQLADQDAFVPQEYRHVVRVDTTKPDTLTNTLAALRQEEPATCE